MGYTYIPSPCSNTLLTGDIDVVLLCGQAAQQSAKKVHYGTESHHKTDSARNDELDREARGRVIITILNRKWEEIKFNHVDILLQKIRTRFNPFNSIFILKMGPCPDIKKIYWLFF